MAPKKKKVSDSKLVLMEKDGEQLEVHPTTVESHKAVGWTVIGGDKAIAEAQANVESEGESDAGSEDAEE
jgi:hypothetical protein